MKRLLAAFAAALLCAAMLASQTTAQSSDLGETDMIVQACRHVTAIATVEFLTVKNCRRAEPDAVVGNNAEVVVRIATKEYGPFRIRVSMSKSLWHAHTIHVE